MGQINPPPRLLMGPGPVDADPRVLRAQSAALVGQFDPWMTQTMTQTQSLWRDVFVTDNEQTLIIDGTARAGIEAALVSLVEPGDRVLVPVFGRFGHLLREIAERVGAEVHVIEAPWGTVFPESVLREAIDRVKPSLVALVHGDTSTTVAQPLDGLGAYCADRGILLYVDATASLGGNTLHVDELGSDAITTGLQKCLGGPSGSAPASFSPRAVEAIMARRSVEAGIRVDGDEVAENRIQSNYFDLAMIFDYWGPKRLNHHTEATSALYGARECARIIVEDGIDATVARHELAGRAMVAGIQGLGLGVYGDLANRMNNVTGVVIPDGVSPDGVRGEMLEHFGIEIGTSFGPLNGKVWRIGTMGLNARKDAVLTTLAALETCLRRAGAAVPVGGGVDAALDTYAGSPG